MKDLVKPLLKTTAEQLFNSRPHETKFGQVLAYPNSDDISELELLKNAGIKYVIFGVPECIGPIANCGNQGAEKGWTSFLSAFLSIQKTAYIDPEKVAILGHIDVSEQMEIGLSLSPKQKHYIESLRQITDEIDTKVEAVAMAIKRFGMLPIVIGGGHNNAYPLIKASAKVYEHPIASINCDPHADCRPLEGRHSGNSFSYALEEGHLAAYSVLGLHRNYNSQYMLDYLGNNDAIRFRFWEDITDWPQELDAAFAAIAAKDLPLGLELDMDAIAMMPSSAVSPVGLQMAQARAYIRKMATHQQIAYLHLPEAAPQSDMEKVMVGKALTYLVTDFLHINSHI